MNNFMSLSSPTQMKWTNSLKTQFTEIDTVSYYLNIPASEI